MANLNFYHHSEMEGVKNAPRRPWHERQKMLGRRPAKPFAKFNALAVSKWVGLNNVPDWFYFVITTRPIQRKTGNFSP